MSQQIIRMHKKRGTKTLFKDYMMQEAYKLGALGLTLPEIADFWKVGSRTLDRYCASNPELKTQITKGKAEADLTVIQALLEQARNGNIAAAIFWLKNRCGWRDVQPVFQNTIVNQNKAGVNANFSGEDKELQQKIRTELLGKMPE